MGGGLLQLVAYGAQDIYLTGQPQITFFKEVYKRHTNFAIESILIVPDDSPTLGTRIEVPISRNGDLLKRVWLQINPKLMYPKSTDIVKLTTIVNDFCHSLFTQIEFQIGGQVIDRLYGSWLTIWRNLSEDNPYGSVGSIDKLGARNITQATSFYNRMAYTNNGISISQKIVPVDADDYLSFANSNTECYIPVPFWFCKNPGLAIPLIALQYHDVRLILTISNFTNFATSLVPQINNNNVINFTQSLKVYGDYVYLDVVERKQFIDNAHEYLIEQVQKKTTQNQNNIKLAFKNPVKEIIITGQPNNPYALSPIDSSNNVVLTTDPVNYVVTDPTYGLTWSGVLPGGKPRLKYYSDKWIYSTFGSATPQPIILSSDKYLYNFADYNGEYNDNISRTNVTLKLVLNGKDQFTARNVKYFTRKTIWESHTGIGAGNWGSIAVIPFCLNAENTQPSGAVNFSVITDARLIFSNFSASERLNSLDIYAISYNILKITAGMGGLIYS